MKSRIRNISISKPCEENWNSMSGKEADRFCSICQKNVINFEGVSEKEIIKFLELKNENVCGRFKINQIEEINRILTKNMKRKINQKAASILIGTFLLGSSCSTNKLATHQNYNKAKFEINNSISNQDSLINSIIIGNIIDENKNPLPFVNVEVKKKKKNKEPIGTITDESGSFKLVIPKNNIYQNKMEINYLGYQSSYLQLNQIENKEIEITMKETGIILGEVCIEKKK